MKTFKEYLVEMGKKKKKIKDLATQAELVSKRGIGPEAALAMRGRGGAIPSKKSKEKAKQRKWRYDG